MSELLSRENREEVRRMFSRLDSPVRLVFFTQKHACRACRDQQELLEDVAALSDRIELEIHDLVEDRERAREYGIRRIPATAVVGERDYGIRFYGVTAGYEFPTLVEDILMVSTGEVDLDPAARQLADRIHAPVHLEVLVSLTCPYCPRVVRLAHQLAFLHDNIRADMEDVAEFPELAQRYQASGVPLTVVNERPAFEGALPPVDAVLEILRIAEPATFEEIDAAMRQATGERRARALDPERVYDVLVVGAGPAAVTAAIYAARKALDVAVVGDEPGGQIRNTATIENWPGMLEVGGAELADRFRRHMEHYPLAEGLHQRVAKVDRHPEEGFVVETDSGDRLRARTVVYCAGKRYRTLGVPGESRFLGRGIAFCATCDAPLHRDHRVVVVGGGNSAFTAARDLLPWAREIHIVNILPDFQADPVLQDAVRGSPRVHLHPGMEVVEFLGDDRLRGVRLRAVRGEDLRDLPADGVFLEIGLVPNTGPVARLLDIEPGAEVPVAPDQSTPVPGLFAAGDASSEPVKQIVVAAGAGAKAALSAHAFLQRQGHPASG